MQLANAIECEVMFLLLAHPMDIESPSGGNPAWAVYRQAMRDTATRHGLPLVDVPEVFLDSGLEASELFSDALHPSSTGHTLMGQAVSAALQPWAAGKPWKSSAAPLVRPIYTDAFAPIPAH